MIEENRVARANRLLKMTRVDGWTDYLDILENKERALYQNWLNSKDEDLDKEIKGRIKQIREDRLCIGYEIEEALEKGK